MPDHEIEMLPADGTAQEPEVESVPQPVAPPEPRADAATIRQTMSYLRGLMQSHGLAPKSKLGQNFLIDLNLLDVVCRAAELSRDDSILEVGTGTGSLTGMMSDQAGAVFTVEIDSDFQKLAMRMLGRRENIRFHLGDALARKNLLNPEVLTGWEEWTTQHHCTKRKLVANLPYVIATPLISNLLLSGIEIERMVVMVQWEIAERLRATVGTKDYNALSVLVQSVAHVETVRKVAPTNFFPKPKVDSAIVLIRPDPEKRKRVGDVTRFRVFLRDLYVHRRKNLRQALSGWPGGRREKTDVDARLAGLGIDGSLRAETLTIEQHLQLCEVFG